MHKSGQQKSSLEVERSSEQVHIICPLNKPHSIQQLHLISELWKLPLERACWMLGNSNWELASQSKLTKPRLSVTCSDTTTNKAGRGRNAGNSQHSWQEEIITPWPKAWNNARLRDGIWSTVKLETPEAASSTVALKALNYAGWQQTADLNKIF